MKTNKTEELLEKYLEGNTSLEEEKELKIYFSSQTVPSHLVQYKFLFEYYTVSKKETTKEFKASVKKNNNIKWFGIAASIAFIVTLSTFMYLQNSTSKQEDLGTFESPEEAFIETHKALQLVANNINLGMESVSYLEEYEKTKKIIFK
jgi:hypothetical protein